MAMLAERKRKTKWVINPTKKPLWKSDLAGIKLGKELMEKMGWAPGKGLGLKEQGIQEPLKVSYKNDTKGMGFKGNDEDWIEHQDEFNSLLNQLTNSNDGVIIKPSTEEKTEIKSLEEKSKKSKARVHYQKFTRGKDLSRYSENDLACILGTNKIKKDKKVKENVEKEENKKQTKDGYETSFGVTTINSGSIQDYFKKKWTFGTHKTNNSDAVGDVNEHEDMDLIEKDRESKKEQESCEYPVEENNSQVSKDFKYVDSVENDEKMDKKKRKGKEREQEFGEEPEDVDSVENYREKEFTLNSSIEENKFQVSKEPEDLIGNDGEENKKKRKGKKRKQESPEHSTEENKSQVSKEPEDIDLEENGKEKKKRKQESCEDSIEENKCQISKEPNENDGEENKKKRKGKKRKQESPEHSIEEIKSQAIETLNGVDLESERHKQKKKKRSAKDEIQTEEETNKMEIGELSRGTDCQFNCSEKSVSATDDVDSVGGKHKKKKTKRLSRNEVEMNEEETGETLKTEIDELSKGTNSEEKVSETKELNMETAGDELGNENTKRKKSKKKSKEISGEKIENIDENEVFVEKKKKKEETGETFILEINKLSTSESNCIEKNVNEANDVESVRGKHKKKKEKHSTRDEIKMSEEETRETLRIEINELSTDADYCSEKNVSETEELNMEPAEGNENQQENTKRKKSKKKSKEISERNVEENEVRVVEMNEETGETLNKEIDELLTGVSETKELNMEIAEDDKVNENHKENTKRKKCKKKSREMSEERIENIEVNEVSVEKKKKKEKKIKKQSEEISTVEEEEISSESDSTHTTKSAEPAGNICIVGIGEVKKKKKKREKEDRSELESTREPETMEEPKKKLKKENMVKPEDEEIATEPSEEPVFGTNENSTPKPGETDQDVIHSHRAVLYKKKKTKQVIPPKNYSNERVLNLICGAEIDKFKGSNLPDLMGYGVIKKTEKRKEMR